MGEGVDDEPLEGDIGPAAGAARPAGAADAAEELRRHEELRRYEAQREERRRRTNAVSGRIAVVLIALLLAFLVYDSARTAVAAHSRGDDWIYPPAVIAGICGAALSALLTWAVRRVK